MEEFALLFLRGERAAGYKRMDLACRIVTSLAAFCVIIPALIALISQQETLPTALQLSFVLAGAAFTAVSALLTWRKERYTAGLLEQQNAANRLEGRGEWGKRQAFLYENYAAVFGNTNYRIISTLLCLLGQLFIYAACCLLLLLPNRGLWGSFLFFAAIVCIVGGALAKSSREGNLRAEFYRRAGKEYAEAKREAGYSDARISNDINMAQSTASIHPTVGRFLKEDAEREEFRRLKKSNVAVVIVSVLAFVACFVLMESHTQQCLGSTVSWSVILAIFALMTVGIAIFALKYAARERDIFMRNAEKLTDSELDLLRRALQTQWMRLQKRGNLMFAACFGAGILAGVILGIIGTVLGKNTDLLSSVGSCVLLLTIACGVVSLIIWTIMYAVARRKLKPTELEIDRIK